MADIMQYILNSDKLKRDPDGNLLNLDDWSEQIAHALAHEERIELTPEHWEVLRLLREQYQTNGPWTNARTVLKILESTQGVTEPRKQLYHLFPQGPVRQACKIAGLPVPANSSDPSFGSVH